MKKRFANRIASMVMALCMICTMSMPSFATDTVTSDGDSASSSVTVSSTNDGTPTGIPAPTAMSVTVPTTLPISVGSDGRVTTATDAKIINNSYGAVKVSKITISSLNGWVLTAFGSLNSLANETIDSRKFGFSITIGTGPALTTDNSNSNYQILLNGAIPGCYIAGVGDPTKNWASISYDAIVTASTNAIADASVANVVFIVEWDT